MNILRSNKRNSLSGEILTWDFNNGTIEIDSTHFNHNSTFGCIDTEILDDI